MTKLKDICDLINLVIDDAFVREKYQIKFYKYLVDQKVTRKEIISFLESSLSIAVTHQIEELNVYLCGGDGAIYIRESYGWMGKPRARKVKEYLEEILDDAKRYEQSKKPGRKPKTANK